MKKWLGGAMLLLMLLALWPGRAWGVELPVQAEAALLMEKETGQVLYAKNEHQAMEPSGAGRQQQHCGDWPSGAFPPAPAGR